jgi:hypothetical protein
MEQSWLSCFPALRAAVGVQLSALHLENLRIRKSALFCEQNMEERRNYTHIYQLFTFVACGSSIKLPVAQ